MCWRSVKLGSVCTLINGRAYKKSELLEQGKYPVLRVGNFFTSRNWYYSDLELEESKYCAEGDLLYAWSASFGPRIWQGGRTIFHYHIWKIDADPKQVLKKFLYYWLEWDAEKIKSDQGTGTTMIHVTKRSMENRFLSLPLLSEQRRIVGILDEAFAGIDKIIANTEQNLSNARELFESYLNNAFTTKGKEWPHETLGVVTKIVNGGTPKSGVSEFWDGGIPWITPKDMGRLTKYYASDTSRTISETGLAKSSARLIPENSVILSTRAPIGHLVVNQVSMAFNQGCRGLVPSDRLITGYLFYFLKMNVDHLNDLGTGATFKELSKTALASVAIPLPPLSEQQRIVEALTGLDEKTQRLEALYQQKLDALNELKQSILQKAFRGDLTKAEAAA